MFTLNNDRWQTWRRKVHLSVFLIRPPAWMFLAGENKQLKAASVIQDTKENIVQHVSGETVLERSTLNIAQKKYRILKCNEGSVNFHWGLLLKPFPEDKCRQSCSSLHIAFFPFFQRLNRCVKINKPIKIKAYFIFSYQRLILQSAWSFLQGHPGLRFLSKRRRVLDQP